MAYAVEIYDDELPKPKWRPVVFAIEQTVDREVYRALMGSPQAQDIARRATDSLDEAQAKLDEMRAEGWKARLVGVQ